MTGDDSVIQPVEVRVGPNDDEDEVVETVRRESAADDAYVASRDMDESGWGTLEIDVVYERDDRVDQDDVVLPSDVASDTHIVFDDDNPEVLAWDRSYTEPRPFNPQNGRWYNPDPDGASYDSTTVGAGIQVGCAYDDCDGSTTIDLIDEIDRDCPSCGESAMGRGQFTSTSVRQRHDQQSVAGAMSARGDEFTREMQQLTDAGVGPAPAMDYLMCSVGDTSAQAWAEARGVSKETVRWNLKQVANALGERVEYKR